MNLSEIKIYVDGPTEIESLKIKFKKEYCDQVPQFGYGPGNGINYDAQTYAKNILSCIVLDLNSRFRKIICIPDLEKRANKQKISCLDFASQLKEEILKQLQSVGHYDEKVLEDTIYVCPSDIMFENWIVCDIESLKVTGLFKSGARQSAFEGQNGARILNDNMTTKYKKTIHAKQLLKKVDKSVAKLNSNSFLNFIDKIDEFVKI